MVMNLAKQRMTSGVRPCALPCETFAPDPQVTRCSVAIDCKRNQRNKS